ncbi:MAG: hypothetical protein RBR01_02725 [Desulfobacterales bacterium]|jgi:hypothetical protein|nr:hypothetical protein [Desulfobacterales bacterium]MDD3949551.1 hypothetical protein [Desulfobacterales bacterium]MDD4463157.1 hypothetical protein [Desulfobacterales bacterium]MDY0377326.1 hypothetical protein [Desulfobacterales bacterium]
MYLSAMTHRDELFDITLRWMNDDFNPEDGKAVTRIFLYESAISSLVIDRMIAFLSQLLNCTFQTQRVCQKQVLREKIIQHLPFRNHRICQLIQDFEENPEYFFPCLPLDAALITASGSNLSAIARIKRLTRVAEKVSFRLVDALFREIQAEARHIAGQRAAAAGVPLADLESSPADMQKDFIQAEAAVAGRFKSKNVRIAREALAINDIIGLKIIGEPELIERLPMLLDLEPGITLVETERHVGDYNAVNLLVDIDLPAPNALGAHLAEIDWSIADRRGLNADEVRRNAFAYAAHGARTVRVEIILTTYEELMESEFGRSIHELRVLRLRQRQAYSGPIAQNAGYLIEYLLVLASSPTINIPELPVKMYGRYLPEAIAALKCSLCKKEVDGDPLSAFCLKPKCSS